MNNTVIPQEKLTNLKDLVSRIEKLEIDLKRFDVIYVENGFRLTKSQSDEMQRYKKVKKEYQKKINEIIKIL